MENIENLSRKELQALAKVHGIKANLASAEIIAQLKLIEQPKREECTVEQTVSEAVVDESIANVEEHAIEPVETTTDVEVTEIPTAITESVTDAEPTVSDEENIVIATSSSTEEAVEIVPCSTSTKNVEDCNTGDEVEVLFNGEWKLSTIKRMNKKSARVCLNENNTELTAKFEDVRFPVAASVSVDVDEELELAPPVHEEVSAVTEAETIVQDETVTTVTEMVIEPATEIMSDIVEENEAETIQEACPVEKIITEEQEEVNESEEKADAQTAKENMMDVEKEILNESEAFAPESTEEVEMAVEPSAPLTPQPFERNSMSIGWNSCTKFSLPDSALKSTNGKPVKQKERRNARRSAMEKLAESMRQETLQAEQQAAMDTEETEADSESVETVAISVEPTPAVVVIAPPTPAVDVVAPPTPAVDVVAPPSPAPLPAAVAPPATTAASEPHKEMLPRMNKAQVIRLEAIQKKIETSDTNPTPSTAFTAAANRPTPTSIHAAPKRTVLHTASRHSVAHTPLHHRSSISTSAPSTAQLMNRPKHTPTAPTPSSAKANRLSMQVGMTSGNKRKLSDSVDSRSHSANAPDFKRMHSKQFSTLKSIAECVDQDKSIGARMTTEMESAMKKQNNISSSSSSTQPAAFKTHHTVEITKPATNPFNKVLNKASNGTPAKVRPTGATPLGLSSRPAGSSSAKSSNIIKSRTVTSFVPTGAISCGGKVTSFVNNENAPGSGNVTSFLKSGKESGNNSASMHKHRSVSISNGAAVNHGSTKQRLQMH